MTEPHLPGGEVDGPDVGDALFARGAVIPGMAGTTMPPIVTQPAGAGGGELAPTAGVVTPGIAGSTIPPKFTQPAGTGACEVAVLAVGGGSGGGPDKKLGATGNGGATGAVVITAPA
ncbi:MAG TPA: hypothetical protein VGI10_14730 [Polyangiaceae bacterium]|jgi:hypothetical protein